MRKKITVSAEVDLKDVIEKFVNIDGLMEVIFKAWLPDAIEESFEKFHKKAQKVKP